MLLQFRYSFPTDTETDILNETDTETDILDETDNETGFRSIANNYSNTKHQK